MYIQLESLQQARTEENVWKKHTNADEQDEGSDGEEQRVLHKVNLNVRVKPNRQTEDRAGD